MSEKHFAKPATAKASSYFSMYLPHIQPLMQDLLRTLANIDFEPRSRWRSWRPVP